MSSQYRMPGMDRRDALVGCVSPDCLCGESEYAGHLEQSLLAGAFGHHRHRNGNWIRRHEEVSDAGLPGSRMAFRCSLRCIQDPLHAGPWRGKLDVTQSSWRDSNTAPRAEASEDAGDLQGRQAVDREVSNACVDLGHEVPDEHDRPPTSRAPSPASRRTTDWLHAASHPRVEGIKARRPDHGGRGVSGFSGAPSKTRTCDLQVRNLTLYPTELWARKSIGSGSQTSASTPGAPPSAGTWRREWDSNPRYPFGYTHFPGACLQPLGHLSFDPSETSNHDSGPVFPYRPASAARRRRAQRATGERTLVRLAERGGFEPPITV